MKLECPAI